MNTFAAYTLLFAVPTRTTECDLSYKHLLRKPLREIIRRSWVRFPKNSLLTSLFRVSQSDVAAEPSVLFNR